MGNRGRDYAPLLTISVAACNVERYIGACLESLCDYRFLGRLEVVVIDDGGTDGTMRTARIYAERLPGVITLVHKNNEGWGSTVNYSIAHAHGRYYRILDGDDLVDTEALEAELQVLEETDADLVYTPHVEFFDREGEADGPGRTVPGGWSCGGMRETPQGGPGRTVPSGWFCGSMRETPQGEPGRTVPGGWSCGGMRETPQGGPGRTVPGGPHGWREPAPAEGVHPVEEVVEWMDPAMHNATWKTSLLRAYVRVPDHCFYTDTEYMMEALHHCRDVYLLRQAVYWYRRGREGQSTSTEGLRRHRGDHLHMIEDLMQYLAEEGILQGKTSNLAEKGILQGKTSNLAEEGILQGKTSNLAEEGVLKGKTSNQAVDRKLRYCLSGSVMGQYKEELFFGPEQPYEEELRRFDERMQLGHPDLVRQRWKCGLASRILRLWRPLGFRGGYRLLCRAVRLANRYRGWYL